MILAFYTYQPLSTLELAFSERAEAGDSLMLIGYSRGALMMRVSRLIGYNERGHMEIDGYASLGNSGGPVLIPGAAGHRHRHRDDARAARRSQYGLLPLRGMSRQAPVRGGAYRQAPGSRQLPLASR